MKKRKRRMIDLDVAYTWICPRCQHRNFCLPVPCELTPAERTDLEQQIPVHHSLVEPVEWLSDPKEAVCDQCQREYKIRSVLYASRDHDET